MKVVKYSVILIIIISSAGFNMVKNQAENFEVKYFGALKNMMHKGDISAKVDLTEFENTNHFFALGAVENLKGEIQIFDSKPINSGVVEDKIVFDNTFNTKATLLVYSVVSNWVTINIPKNVKTYDQFETYLESAASDYQIDINKPFPFIIEGKTESLDWHVIDWEEGDKEHSHEKHKTSGLFGTISNNEVEMLGFYSDSHHAIFTHHSTNMHVHTRTIDNTMAGHVDDFILGDEMILKLPGVER